MNGDWMQRLVCLLFKHPSYCAAADLASMTTDERKGVYYFLRRIDEAGDRPLASAGMAVA